MLKTQRNKVYGWFSEKEREGLFRLAQSIIGHREETFQDRLEQATLHLITEKISKAELGFNQTPAISLSNSSTVTAGHVLNPIAVSLLKATEAFIA